jgi:hypothetical protein
LKRVAADEPLREIALCVRRLRRFVRRNGRNRGVFKLPQIHNACNGFHLTPLMTVICAYNPT